MKYHVYEGFPRSPHWRVVERANKKGSCEACGRARHLEVHHVLPFHLHPRQELEPSNLITLCRRCHLLFGHWDDWQSFNPQVRGYAAALLKIKGEHLASALASPKVTDV